MYKSKADKIQQQADAQHNEQDQLRARALVNQKHAFSPRRAMCFSLSSRSWRTRTCCKRPRIDHRVHVHAQYTDTTRARTRAQHTDTTRARTRAAQHTPQFCESPREQIDDNPNTLPNTPVLRNGKRAQHDIIGRLDFRPLNNNG